MSAEYTQDNELFCTIYPSIVDWIYVEGLLTHVGWIRISTKFVVKILQPSFNREGYAVFICLVAVAKAVVWPRAEDKLFFGQSLINLNTEIRMEREVLPFSHFVER